MDRSTQGSTSSTTSRSRKKARAGRLTEGVPMSESMPSRGPGAGDMFLSVNGARSGKINGEASDDKHKNEIEVLAWSWGMQGKSSLAGGGTSGKATVRELRIT